MLAPIGVMRARRPRRPVSYQSPREGTVARLADVSEKRYRAETPSVQILRLRLSETVWIPRRWISAGKHPRPHHRPTGSHSGVAAPCSKTAKPVPAITGEQAAAGARSLAAAG
jgi:hypothetical protein